MRTIANAIILIALAAIAAVWVPRLPRPSPLLPGGAWSIAARPLAYNVTLLAALALVPAVFVRFWLRRKTAL